MNLPTSEACKRRISRSLYGFLLTFYLVCVITPALRLAPYSCFIPFRERFTDFVADPLDSAGNLNAQDYRSRPCIWAPLRATTLATTRTLKLQVFACIEQLIGDLRYRRLVTLNFLGEVGNVLNYRLTIGVEFLREAASYLVIRPRRVGTQLPSNTVCCRPQN
ncbi:Uncharacterised protein [Mycobacteroides abscessus subsp. abscessus]|nr:Uncharacterised protein [Mycobacteroides abscessus subsp. abscessus]